MARSRIHLFVQLALLLGLPLVVIAGLFGVGVYLGIEHRAPVLTFERDVLRLDVADVGGDFSPRAVETSSPHSSKVSGARDAESAHSTPRGETQLVPGSSASTAADAGAALGTRAPSEHASKGTGQNPSAPVVAVEAGGAGSRTLGAETQSEPSYTAPSEARVEPAKEPSAAVKRAVPTTQAGAVGGAGSFGLPATVSVKVLVDRDLIESQPDWIAYVQRLVSNASMAYRDAVGVELSLYGVTTWNVPTRGVSAQALLDDLRGRTREGAHVLLGLTARVLDETVTVRGDQPGPESLLHGAYAVVYSAEGLRSPHLQPFLHELGHVLGATDVSNPASDAFRQGSWMRSAPGIPDAAPWLDPENRKRIIDRKMLPFAPESKVEAKAEKGKQWQPIQ